MHRSTLALALLLVAQSSAPSLAGFPGDDGLLVFTRYAIGNLAGQVATVPAESKGEVTLLTATPVPLSATPVWSPDGSCIAFYSERDSGNQEIYVMRADGSVPTRITVHPAVDYDPAWSPDGRQLAFVSQRDGDYEIYVVDLENGATTKLTDNVADDYTPSWSPDGESIVFASGRDGNLEIYTMGANGADQKRRTENDGLDLYPNWSPDGLSIAFATEREGSKGRDIWVMGADGENAVSVVSREGTDSDPVWSPSGKYIAFNGYTGTAGDHLLIVESSGSEEVQVTEAELFDDRGPDWQPINTEPNEKQLCPTITPKVCGDANLDAEVKATDALVVLKKAVGQNVVCPKIRCDTDDSDVVLASDAQRTLRFAVGQEVALDCPDVEFP
jgi:Tol biopolymer transport system component